jgi:hypothetical protein
VPRGSSNLIDVMSFDCASRYRNRRSPVPTVLIMQNETMEPNQNGQLWCVKVSEELSTGGEIYLHADHVEHGAAGDLIFMQVKQDENGKADRKMVLGIAAGEWLCVYAVSAVGGSPIGVDHGLAKSS